MTHLVFLCWVFTVSSLLEPFGSCFILSWTNNKNKKNGKAGDSEANHSSLKLLKSHKNSPNSLKLLSKDLLIMSFPFMLLEPQISPKPLAKRLILNFFHQSFLSLHAYDQALGRDLINGHSKLVSQRQFASVWEGAQCSFDRLY